MKFCYFVFLCVAMCHDVHFCPPGSSEGFHAVSILLTKRIFWFSLLSPSARSSSICSHLALGIRTQSSILCLAPPPGLGTQHLPEVSFLLYCSLFISFRFFSRNFIALCCILCIVLYCIGLIMTGKPAHKWFFHQIMMRTDVDVDVVRTDQGVDVRQGENHDLKKKILSHQER